MKQKTVKFYLDKPDAKEPTDVIAYYYAGKNVKHATGFKIHPREWDFEKQIPLSDHRKLVTRIRKITTWINEFTEDGTKRVKAEDLKNYLLTKDGKEPKTKALKKQQLPTPKNFQGIIGHYIELAESKKITTPQGSYYTEGSIKNWKKFQARMEEFNPDLKPDEITMDTYRDFENWCNEEPRNYTKNYVGDLIKHWKNFLGLSFGTFHNNTIHLQKGFRKYTEIVDKVYLTSDEIKKLKDLKLSGTWEKIRDRFLVMLYTGMRVSDSQKLTKANFKKSIIAKVNKKTGKKSAVPIHPIIAEMLRKYDGELPPTVHENTINHEIKKIAKEAGIDDLFTYSITRGGVQKEETDFKYNLISTHTCRRSYATNKLKEEDLHTVAKALGMSIKTLERYNKLSAEDNAELMAEREEDKLKPKEEKKPTPKSAPVQVDFNKSLLFGEDVRGDDEGFSVLHF